MSEGVLESLTWVVVLGIGAQWVAWRFRLPSILVLLIVGFLAGPVLGWVEPDRLLGELLMPLVALSVALILFEGGLSLKWSELAGVGKAVRNLISIGAVVTWGVAAGAAHLILGWSVATATLLGAILVVTGPTVVGPLLRHVKPRRTVASALKWEGILIDPIGALLAVLVFEAIHAGEAYEAAGLAAWGFLKIVLVGSLLGVAAAYALTNLFSRHWVPDYLQNPVSLMLVVAVFAFSNALQEESGLLAVTLMGITLANQKQAMIGHIVEFKENLRVLLISGLFIILAARIDMEALQELEWGRSLLFVAVLILLARPLSVGISVWGTPIPWRERCFLACLAPRGIVAAAIASLFALRLSRESYPEVAELVPITFLTILGTVSIYGLGAAPLARWLGVAQPNPQGVILVGAHAAGRQMAKALQDEQIPVLLVDTNRRNLTRARMEGLATYYGSILSEDIAERLELAGFGHLLALTSNPSVNSLAAMHFVEFLGRSAVYQLPTGDDETSADKVSQELQGRTLFGPNVSFAYLEQAMRGGGQIRKTRLTQEFDYKQFQRHYRNRAVPLFLISEGGRVRVFTMDHPPTPQPGDLVISLISGEEMEREGGE